MDDGLIRTAMLSDIQHIEDLIDETLTYLRNDVSTEKLQRADIASVLQTVCAEFSDVGFPVSYSGPDRLLGWCKPNALARAITNLCDNGVRFAGNVTVALTQTDTVARIAVVDDGPGIPTPARARVFEPFFKEDTSRGGTSKHGFGLGSRSLRTLSRATAARSNCKTTSQPDSSLPSICRMDQVSSRHKTARTRGYGVFGAGSKIGPLNICRWSLESLYS
ncbi:putative Histidine kinase [Mesorhizobium ventifaucium]|uniref:histidine kinase n=2 Tax=Mesorhizobium ventifaucium TaxID=666020 RepID=A0ABM9E292_9HYPH|nr:putative Histidine kinase [Mesorhizobium ventifaucium]